MPGRVVTRLIPTALPAGRTFISIQHSAKSAWTITGKLTARTTEGRDEQYFVKVCPFTPIDAYKAKVKHEI